ncbi:hypothetical protein AB0J57_33765 [Streptomyces sp. NPDC049837]|uniref:imine reductase family protein n=1 Tax=Streptomyces sp. NPDC049837 TaxID=3155277 RepID=UPI0034329864
MACRARTLNAAALPQRREFVRNATGLAHILGASRAQGVSTGLLAPLHALFQQQIAQGHAAASLSRTIESLRPVSRPA